MVAMMPQDFPRTLPADLDTRPLLVLAWPREAPGGTQGASEGPGFGAAIVVEADREQLRRSAGPPPEELLSAITGLTMAVQSLRESLHQAGPGPRAHPPRRRPRHGIHA